jgi:hypothetical protein
MQWSGLGHVPLVEASVDGCGILAQSSLDMVLQIEADRVVQVDGAIPPDPVDDCALLVVLMIGPRPSCFVNGPLW